MLVSKGLRSEIEDIVFGIRFSIFIGTKKVKIWEEFYEDRESRDVVFNSKQESCFNASQGEHNDCCEFTNFISTWDNGYCFMPKNTIGVLEKFVAIKKYVVYSKDELDIKEELSEDIKVEDNGASAICA